MIPLSRRHLSPGSRPAERVPGNQTHKCVPGFADTASGLLGGVGRLICECMWGEGRGVYPAPRGPPPNCSSGCPLPPGFCFSLSTSSVGLDPDRRNLLIPEEKAVHPIKGLWGHPRPGLFSVSLGHFMAGRTLCPAIMGGPRGWGGTGPGMPGLSVKTLGGFSQHCWPSPTHRL